MLLLSIRLLGFFMWLSIISSIISNVRFMTSDVNLIRLLVLLPILCARLSVVTSIVSNKRYATALRVYWILVQSVQLIWLL
ncbi:hypothetical protein BCR41DRAFT_344645 [Lobosporangium transversale]|uniref:Uncharacterized protein n=1 Tax=Lobosporangium transversale TaxID=64571 RepID=A0A1Y2H0L4_9FUNG|nr:hypothetical protein BCR41DRAFT_344645 [Lobosporangium transversale]ORZ28097.1 hypothetical protein BCR41DRAFT_344645 [Lobosporangium transversale]|eukprot:XP_021885782.1 hypothetical protein BCR41DRAFT_344645 [Lobosporangium transversale]